MSISEFFDNVMCERDVVVAYWVRSANSLIVTGSGSTSSGAVIFNDAGELVRACPTKREALRVLGQSNN